MKKNYLAATFFDIPLKNERTIKSAILLFLFFLGMNDGLAQGNACVTTGAATQFTVGTTCTPVTWNSTNNNGGYWNSATGCGASDDDDIWGWFTATATSTTITYTPVAARDAVLHLFTGTCSTTMTALACADDNGDGGAETITYATTVGVKYQVRVQRYGSSANMNGTICVYSAPTPSNNQCANATNLPCNTSNLAGTTAGTASYAHGSGCTMSNYGVWYTFIGDGNQNIIAATTTSLDIEMAISSGSCGSLSNITCVDDVSTGTESYTLNTVNGTRYYVYIAYYTSGNTTGNFTISRTCLIPPVNDECSGALPLTVNTSCSSSTYSNIGATATTGVTAPGCANYSGGDVWFTAVVPNTGELTVTLQAGTMTDSGMAFYSGTCSSLSLLECDNNGASGSMSKITLTGLTVGQTIFIRVWSNGNTNNGTFGICATTPSCPSPSDLLATVTSATSVTVTWNSSVNATGGYQYFINTTGVAPVAGSTPTGTTAAGATTVSFSGLTSGLKYYFWVRANCGGTDRSTWFGPTNYTPCGVGNGTGSTTLSCTIPVAGAAGTGGLDPTMSCTALTCQTLEVSYVPLKQSTDYVATEIPYAPPYQYTCLQNQVSVNVDDVWSPMINLPFNFCFYGNNYNKCLIGSNGVITFDTTTYTPGSFSTWSFSNNLPNTSLFRNTIFGVYHDIDPSKGGQVGYELITLNTGCRALVASWNEIPMYSSSCSSSYYTGMIVLYENSNVIEVYVKEKNICSSWNGGNAIVGIQNGAGTAAVFPTTPTSSINTNDVNNDWTATNKAWRFTPNGATITPQFQWYTGTTVSPANQIAGGTGSTISVCPTATTSYTAEVTYPLCTGTLKVNDVVVVNVTGSKVWNGSNDTNWNLAANWTPVGIPTSSDCVVIPTTTRNPIISATPDAVGYNLAVYNNAQLTVNSNQNLTITDKITVQPNGIFTINNSASLIQINNILNSGNIIYKRDAPNIRMLDYSYWSSPVAGFNVSNIVSPYTFGPIYRWNPTLANPNGGQGEWQFAAGSTMIAGKGYIARAPNAAPYNSGSGTLNGTFTGVPHNGDISIAIERGNDQNTAYHTGSNGIEITNLSDNWNLLGNPYPSAIRASQFLFDNRTKIEGNVRLWTHGTLPSNLAANPFYSSFTYNYSEGDYYTYNFTGTSCCPAAGSDLFIGSGQGFFVQMIDGAPVSAANNITVNFNNGLRSTSFSNSTFYRNANATTSANAILDVNSIERNRIWLDIINPNGQYSRTLFGYIQEATMGTDSFFDCITETSGETQIYSETGNTKFSIQGRSLPFDINDQVAIGINVPTTGNYTIAIAAVDGLFNNQNIYLKDELLNITHDLKANPYHFSSNANMGGINDRFKIVYINNTLGIPTQTFENNIMAIVNDAVAVSSSNLDMESIAVYNLLGQELDTYKNIDSNYIILSNLRKNNATVLLKIKLQTGELVTKKIIF